MRNFLMTILLLAGLPSAQAASCELCRIIDSRLQAIENIRKTTQNPDLIPDRTALHVVDVVERIWKRIDSKKELKTEEIDAILRFIAETKEDDQLLTAVEAIHGDYLRRQSLYEARIKNLKSSQQSVIRSQIKEYQRRQKSGNG